MLQHKTNNRPNVQQMILLHVKFAIYIVIKIAQIFLASIEKELGGSDHSTIVYALSQVVKNINKDSRFMAIVIEDMIKNIRDR